MPTPIAVIAADAPTRDRLATLVPHDVFIVTAHSPDKLPDELPCLFIIALPGLETSEERLIEQLRANPETTHIPIIIASSLPMIQLQSVPYASDWTIAIVEEPVNPQILAETMGFLLNP